MQANGINHHPAHAVLVANVTERDGLQSSRERINSASISNPESNCVCDGSSQSDSDSACGPNCSSSDEQLPAMGWCSIANKIVGVCSMARRKRNHVVSGMRRASCGG